MKGTNTLRYNESLKKPLGVTAFTHLDSSRLLITFTTGEKKVFDVLTLLQEGPVFEPLGDEVIRGTARIIHDFLSWMDGEIDISTDYLYKEGTPYTDTDWVAEKVPSYPK